MHTQGRPVSPSARWVFSRFDRLIAFGFGAGLLRPAPGTWGTLLAWFLWFVALSRLPDQWLGIVLLASFALGSWACQRCGHDLGVADHGGMVWDEVVAFWLVLWLTPDGLWMQALGFIIFRAFDILKPPPIRYFDQRIKNGFGVMLDDLLAAVYTLLVIRIMIQIGGLE
ncbi:MAG TPA: phosphatidylglycerophosphatase A [Castellaniella sp.]|nr:phosphatidylglycerophosphatase A [Castellaniella sp.]